MIEKIIAPATNENQRNSEGDVVVLKDGTLLAAWSEFYGGGRDDSKARISGKRSKDGGRTWDSKITLRENTGKLNVMSASFLRLASGELLLEMFLQDFDLFFAGEPTSFLLRHS